MGAIKIKTTVKLNADVMRRAKERLKGAPDKVSAHRAHVGILEDEGGEAKKNYAGKSTGMTIAQVAMFQEYNGRSWLRTWFDENVSRFKTEMADAMRAEFQGDRNAVPNQTAIWAAELRDWIQLQQGGLEALKDATIARKTEAGLSHPDVPLLATGQLLESIKAMIDGTMV